MRGFMLLAGVALLATPALAQVAGDTGAVASGAATADDSLADIVVTARKRAETAQEVPLTINVVSQEQIERQNISTLSDVVKLTPSFTFADGLAQGDPRISIRGQSNIRAASQPTVGVFIDGIDVPYLSGLNTESLDIARIEVIKGPQSALFGRGVEAGAVNYVSRRPEFDTNGYVQGEVATRELYEVRGRVNVPASETFAVAASGRYKYFDGFYRNRLSNRRTIGGSEIKAGALAARLKPDDRFEAYARVSYSDEYLEQDARNAVDSNTRTGPGATQVWYVGKLRADRFRIFSNGDDYAGYRRKVFTASLLLDYDFGPATLSTITGYNRTKRLIDVDGDYIGATSFSIPLNSVFGNNLRAYSDLTLKSFSQEVRLASSDDGPFRWLVGGYYQRQTNDILAASVRGTIATPQTTPLSPQADLIKTLAGFGSLSYQFGGFRISGEIRFNRDRVQSVVPLRPFLETFKNTLPRLTAEYAFSRDVRVYASAAKGSKPGGFNLNPGAGTVALPANFIPFQEEASWQYELGIKSELLDRKLILNVAAYYIDWKDIQVDDQFVTAAGTVGYTSNAGKAKVKGFEVEAQFRPTRRFTVNAGYSYAPARIYDYQLAQARAANIVTLGKRHLPFTSDHTATLGLAYEQPVSDDWTAFAESNTRYSSRQFATVANLAYRAQRSSTDVRIGARSDRFELTGYVNNVFQTRRAESVATFVNLQSGLRNWLVTLPSPRQFGLRARANF